MITLDVRESSYLFDALSNVNESQLRARIDNFFVSLLQNPELKGHLITYGERNDVASAAKIYKVITNHLVFRRFPADRMVVTKGGYREETAVEMWMVPPGGEIPVSKPTVDKVFLSKRSRPKK